MNQGKLEVVEQETARMNVDILGISELKWAGMGEFNSDDHYMQCQPYSRPPLTHTSARASWTLRVKSGSVSCRVTAPFSWVLVCTRFCLCLQESVSQSCVSSSSSVVGIMVTSSKRAYDIPKSSAPRAPVPAADHC